MQAADAVLEEENRRLKEQEDADMDRAILLSEGERDVIQVRADWPSAAAMLRGDLLSASEARLVAREAVNLL